MSLRLKKKTCLYNEPKPQKYLYLKQKLHTAHCIMWWRYKSQIVKEQRFRLSVVLFWKWSNKINDLKMTYFVARVIQVKLLGVISASKWYFLDFNNVIYDKITDVFEQILKQMFRILFFKWLQNHCNSNNIREDIVN